MATTRPKSRAFMIWNVPVKIKERFKATCARQGQTMRKTIIDFMEKHTKRNA